MKCNLCGKEIKEKYSHNAHPFSGRCCDECNSNVVIPMRIMLTRNEPMMFTDKQEVKYIKPSNNKKFTVEELTDLIGNEISFMLLDNCIVVFSKYSSTENIIFNDLFRNVVKTKLSGNIIVVKEKYLE